MAAGDLTKISGNYINIPWIRADKVISQTGAVYPGFILRWLKRHTFLKMILDPPMLSIK
jgi:hypothetical protein